MPTLWRGVEIGGNVKEGEWRANTEDVDLGFPRRSPGGTQHGAAPDISGGGEGEGHRQTRLPPLVWVFARPLPSLRLLWNQRVPP